MLSHANHLEDTYGAGPHTISVPRLRPADGSDIASKPPHEVGLGFLGCRLQSQCRGAGVEPLAIQWATPCFHDAAVGRRSRRCNCAVAAAAAAVAAAPANRRGGGAALEGLGSHL